MLFIEWDAPEKALRVLRLAIVEPFRILYQIDNLFVADGSLDGLNGGFNPSLTIMGWATGSADTSPASGKGPASDKADISGRD